MAIAKSLFLILTSLLFLGKAFADSPPVFDSISSPSVAAGESHSITINATDPEGGTVSILTKGLQSWMSFSNNTLTLAPGSEHVGFYAIRFQASDGYLKSLATAYVTVTGAPADNLPPGFGDIPDRSVRENTAVTVQLGVYDPDWDPVTVSVSPNLSWVNINGGLLELSPDYYSSGNYTLTLTASDGRLSTVTTMQVTVVNIDQVPEFESVSPPLVPEGGTVDVPIVASDPDGDALTVTASGLASWMSFDGSILSMSPGYGDAGSYTARFVASGSQLGASLTLDIEVTETGLPPQWSDVKTDWTIGDGTVLSLPLEAVDPDGDVVTVSIPDAPSWVSFDGKVLRARPGQGVTGLFPVTLRASDSEASSDIDFSINVQPGMPGFPANWMSYIGSVGGIGADWAEWKRYWLVGVTGISLVDDPTLISKLESSAISTLETQDLMLPVAGFAKDEEKMADYLSFMINGGRNEWQAAVTSQVETLSPLDPDAKRIFYQLGNEITTENISANIRNWAESSGWSIPGEAKGYDHETIDYYVEYYLAPTIEAANLASEAFYGDADKLNIVLGSIGNGGNQEARDFLDALLEYEIQGWFAPSLQSVRVYELIDLISVHYVGTSDNLDLIWDKWKNVGSIRGLWNTEEIGIRAAEAGSGAGKAIQATGRHLEWFYRTQLDPDQSRVAYYAWDIDSADTSVSGTSSDESMRVLQDFMGNVPLEVLTDSVSSAPADANLLLYQYNSLEDDNKRMVVVPADNTLESSLVESIHMDSQGWNGTVDATVHYFSPTSGHTSETYTLTNTESGYDLVLSTPVTLHDKGDALLITLQKQ